jgi:hypothetical protein
MVENQENDKIVITKIKIQVGLLIRSVHTPMNFKKMGTCTDLYIVFFGLFNNLSAHRRRVSESYLIHKRT